MKVEIAKWGDDVYGIKVIVENENLEELAILKRFFEGGAKTNVWGGYYVQFTFADMLEKPKEAWKTLQRVDNVAKLIRAKEYEEAVKTLSQFRQDIREESREQLVTELSRTLAGITESTLGSVIKGLLEKMLLFPIEPIRATRAATVPPMRVI